METKALALLTSLVHKETLLMEPLLEIERIVWQQKLSQIQCQVVAMNGILVRRL